jgi:hypothetical protein
VGRVVIATAEFASIPPFLLPSYPGGFIPTAIGMRFPGMTESIGPMWSKTKPTNQTLGTGSYRLPSVGPAPQVKERVGRTTLFSSSAMSSGRLFLDRVGRHQSPSPLHRRDQNKLIALSAETNYHRAVGSVLIGCLTFRDKRILPTQSLIVRTIGNRRNWRSRAFALPTEQGMMADAGDTLRESARKKRWPHSQPDYSLPSLVRVSSFRMPVHAGPWQEQEEHERLPHAAVPLRSVAESSGAMGTLSRPHRQATPQRREKTAPRAWDLSPKASALIRSESNGRRCARRTRQVCGP